MRSAMRVASLVSNPKALTEYRVDENDPLSGVADAGLNFPFYALPKGHRSWIC
jgi:hypothetical protein